MSFYGNHQRYALENFMSIRMGGRNGVKKGLESRHKLLCLSGKRFVASLEKIQR